MRPAAMLLEVDADAVRRARKCLRDVAIRLSELDQKIVVACAVGAGCVRREGLAAIGHRGKRLVVDCNQGRGVFGDVTRLRDYHRSGRSSSRLTERPMDLLSLTPSLAEMETNAQYDENG